MAGKCLAGRPGRIPSLPAAGACSGGSEAVRLGASSSHCLAAVRDPGTCSWRPFRRLPGEASGPADPGILSGDLQHSGFLACHPFASDLLGMAWLAAGGSVSTCRHGGSDGDGSGPAAPCHPSGPDFKYHRRGKYCAPHPGEAGGRAGVGLCAVCQGKRRVLEIHCPAPRPSQRAASRHHPPVCLCQ